MRDKPIFDFESDSYQPKPNIFDLKSNSAHPKPTNFISYSDISNYDDEVLGDVEDIISKHLDVEFNRKKSQVWSIDNAEKIK